jgi:hypothetical protein
MLGSADSADRSARPRPHSNARREEQTVGYLETSDDQSRHQRSLGQFLALSDLGDFQGIAQPHDDHGLTPIALCDQGIIPVEPFADLRKAGRSGFHFYLTIEAEQRHGDVVNRIARPAGLLGSEPANCPDRCRESATLP